MAFFVAIKNNEYFKIPESVLEQYKVSKDEFDIACKEAKGELSEAPDVEGQDPGHERSSVMGVRG